MSYKLLSYRAGRDARAGVLVGDSVYDAARITRDAGDASVLGILENWSRASRRLGQAARRIASGKSRAKGVPLARVKLLAPLPVPGNIYCAGANYTDHVAEMFRAQGQPMGPTMKELGEKPWHFIKTSRSSVVGPGAVVKLPAFSRAVDWEVELAAVIGRPARSVSIDKALNYVAGYTIGPESGAVMFLICRATRHPKAM
jgi:2-keto-4-pentenoate hydratase/2-oxohepta-3-ene-1,7-dioic acid hydratase in catechol pathway